MRLRSAKLFTGSLEGECKRGARATTQLAMPEPSLVCDAYCAAVLSRSVPLCSAHSLCRSLVVCSHVVLLANTAVAATATTTVGIVHASSRRNASTGEWRSAPSGSRRVQQSVARRDGWNAATGAQRRWLIYPSHSRCVTAVHEMSTLLQTGLTRDQLSLSVTPLGSADAAWETQLLSDLSLCFVVLQ